MSSFLEGIGVIAILAIIGIGIGYVFNLSLIWSAITVVSIGLGLIILAAIITIVYIGKDND